VHGYEQDKDIKNIQPLRVNSTGTATKGEGKEDSRPEKTDNARQRRRKRDGKNETK
jgi:hypothetical protein